MKSGLLVGTLLTAVGLVLPSQDAHASSHREAPFITKNPKVDGTDFYMFRSYEAGREAFVTVVANYIPLQNQYGGPNFFSLDPEALYEIHLDNSGDAKEDITFQFRFNNDLAGTKIPVGGEMVAIPLINSGPIGGGGSTDSTNANLHETFSVKMVKGDRRTGTASDVTLASNAATKSFRKPLDYIGQKSFGAPSAYETYARKHIYDVKLDGCAVNARVFVGQRRETFAVNLGVIFDLVNVDALGLGAVAQPLGDVLDPAKSNRAAFSNTISSANVTSIAMELPIDCGRGQNHRRLDERQRPPGARDQSRSELRKADRGRRRLGSGLAARLSARQRGRDRPARQGQVQLQLALERFGQFRHLRHEPHSTSAARNPVRRRRLRRTRAATR
jgi:hypothetical protein